MNSEITRAGDADRDRYYDHLGHLYASGHISSERELESLRQDVLNARSLKVLESVIDGMPRPAEPGQPHRRDYGIPRNFVPPCAAGMAVGLSLAILPSATMSGMHGMAYNFATASTLLLGIILFAISLVTMGAAAAMWEENNEPGQKQARRERDQRR